VSSRFTLAAGTAGTVTVAAGEVVTRIRAHATSAGTLVITPSGGSALPTIALPAGASWFEMDFDEELLELESGSTLVFTSTDSYVVTQRSGAGP
jgi:hypothetical protein